MDMEGIPDSDSAKRRTPRLSAGKEPHFAAPVGETIWVPLRPFPWRAGHSSGNPRRA
ncbi:hypothetical protein ACETWP_07040 [Arthrobacter halodurans]|uniref:Uncharacterized protein n=1 Tax=Arthrobacter halodurans TaxID=516699 RepID=A0ABV4UPZ9_9MICC